MALGTPIGCNMDNQKSLVNPFSDYGGIVFGDAFFGRESKIQTITERVIDAVEPGCISIVGLPRIGKSSLAWHTLVYPQELLQQKHKLVVWISMGSSRNPDEFFRQMISSALESVESANISNDIIGTSANKALQHGLAWIDFQEHMKRFIKSVRKIGWRLVYVIDEFDAARVVFKDNLFAYQYLRELYNNPDNRVCFVTTSRKTISEIEVSADISNLNGIFHQIYLGMFTEIETVYQFEKVLTINHSPDIDLINRIKNFTGSHPYLNAAIGFHLINQRAHEQQIDFDSACSNSRPVFNSYYEHLVGDLRKETVLGKFIDLARGVSTTSIADISDKYKMLELVRSLPNGMLEVFSKNFSDYLGGLEQPLNDIHLVDKGQLLDDKYRILRIINKTNHSQVAEAWEEALERKVAIKCLYLSQHAQKDITQLKKNLEREGRILANLKHSNIGVIYTVIEDPLGIVMEWVDGQSIQDLIDTRRSFDPTEVARIGIIIADALSYAHSHKIIHRDIKPGNIILNTTNEPILIDFDIARIINRETISLNKNGKPSRLGTARYSAPEQFTDPELVSAAVDIFSLGMVLYEMLTYELPYGNLGNLPDNYDKGLLPTPEQKSIPDNLYQVLCQALNQNPKMRPSAIDIRMKLENCN